MSAFKKITNGLRMPDVIVRQIEDQIFLGQLKPDEMLPPENELMKQFGVGRYTVREALRMLEASGLVKIKQGAKGGAIITRLTNEFVSDFLIKAIRFGEVTADDISELRLALEPSMVAILAAKKHIDPAILSQIAANISMVKTLYRKKEVTAYGNMDFHVLLALATGNPMFIILLKTLRAGFDMVLPLKNDIQIENITHHEKILEAIKKRDPAGARERMHKHLVQMAELFATREADYPYTICE